MRVLISAGEPSGDQHAAAVIRALARRVSTVEVDAVGGEALAATGAHMLADVANLGAMGLFEAAASLGRHVRLLRCLQRRVRERRYDLVILVDYPGFHLQVARAAAPRAPVLYYIAPQLWAWGRWRAPALRRTVRRLAVILPFEEPFFRALGVAAHFVGSPLLDGSTPTKSDARRRLGISPTAPVLGLFPGSRAGDRERHGALFVSAAREVRRRVPDAQVLLAAPVSEHDGIRAVPEAALVRGAADAGIVKSGTATLEAALAGMPMVVAYRMHRLTHQIAKRLVRVPYVSLVNLVADRPLVPELLQDAATPAALASAVVPLLDRDNRAAREQIETFGAVRAQLGSPGVAERVAAMAVETAA